MHQEMIQWTWRNVRAYSVMKELQGQTIAFFNRRRSNSTDYFNTESSTFLLFTCLLIGKHHVDVRGIIKQIIHICIRRNLSFVSHLLILNSSSAHLSNQRCRIFFGQAFIFITKFCQDRQQVANIQISGRRPWFLKFMKRPFQSFRRHTVVNFARHGKDKAWKRDDSYKFFRCWYSWNVLSKSISPVPRMSISFTIFANSALDASKPKFSINVASSSLLMVPVMERV